MTIGRGTFPLPDPFIVTATMNPLDGDGTYALPLAQMDRFLLKVLLGYPEPSEELAILERFGGEPPALPQDIVTMDDVRRWQHEGRAVYIDRRVAGYIVDLVTASRAPHEYIERGASPRATLALAGIARAAALLEGRSYVTPDDVRASAPDVLRHRLAFSYRLLVDKVDSEALIATLIARVPVP